MRLVDSHAHLDFEDFHKDFEQVMERAKSASVEKILTIGVGIDRSQRAILLAESCDNVFATVGIHPEEVGQVNLNETHKEMLALGKSSKRVVGIGETGIDYYRGGGNNLEGEPRSEIQDSERVAQRRLFEIHIDIAKQLDLPLVIHIRNGSDEGAVNDAYEILKASGYYKGVIHCFTLNYEWAKRFVDLGYYIGFTGIITYKNSLEIQEAVKLLPLDHILVETDCPFLAPQKYRGKRNEPAYVIEVAEKVAELKGISLQEVADATTMNAEKLFNLLS